MERVFDHETDDGTIRSQVFPSYGCDRFALFQAEFRGNLFMDWSPGWDDEGDPWDDDWNWYPEIDFSPNWAAFFNAATPVPSGVAGAETSLVSTLSLDGAASGSAPSPARNPNARIAGITITQASTLTDKSPL